MKINSINIQNLYSFGPEGTPELKDASILNLFIGKNGSGKSNIFRLLTYKNYLQIFDKTKKYQLILPDNMLNKHIFIPPNNFPNGPALPGRSFKIETNQDVIEFKDGYHIRGDICQLVESIKYICPENSVNSLNSLILKLISGMGDIHLLELIFNFCFKYIFEIDISLDNGLIIEYFSKQKSGLDGGVPVINENWSAGYQMIAIILLEILKSHDKEIIFLDEPELHIEARSCRKFFQILIWICMKDFRDSAQNNNIYLNVNREWELYLTCFLAQQKLNNMKKNDLITHTFPGFRKKQLFITSHSSTLINEFLNAGKIANIYEFKRKIMDSNWQDHRGLIKTSERTSEVSTVSKIDDNHALILNNLGIKGADLLQANGIIWVEGPSDILYLEAWLNMYQNENKEKQLLQKGLNYEFMMYGGSILSWIGYDDPEKLVNIFRFNRNSFVVIDSDAVCKGHLTIDISKFYKAKKYIKTEFENLSIRGYKLGLWYKEGNSDIRTIECYLDDTSKKAHQKSKTKVENARSTIRSWNNSKKISDFHNNLEEEISYLYNMILSWNAY